ncbi:MAG: hypothetical protein SNJ54_13990 [Anaerolineae bacterium]
MRLVCLLGAALLVACAPQLPPQPDTPWGAPRVIAEAPTADAPALLITTQQTWLAWTQPLEGETRHMASDGQQNRILALRAWYPMRYSLLPAANGHAHWLWIDRSAEADELRLHSALVAPELVAQLGPITHSTALTTSYAALPLGDGRVRLVWSQGALGSETLHTRLINADGRPTFTAALNANGMLPALTETRDGVVWLYWVYDRSLWRGQLRDDALHSVEHVEPLPALPLTEQIDALRVAHDAASTYVFWQVTRADGSSYALLSVTDRATGRHLPAAPLRLSVGDHPFDTTYNGGGAFTAAPDGAAAAWLRPLLIDTDTLPAAAVWGGMTGVIYFRDGRLTGVQPLLRTGRLFDAPQLASDDARHLTLVWSQPFSAQAARLTLLTTR